MLLSGNIGKGVVTGNTRSWRSVVLIACDYCNFCQKQRIENRAVQEFSRTRGGSGGAAETEHKSVRPAELNIKLFVMLTAFARPMP